VYNKLVSVIIPTFNRRHILDRAISSVLRQSHPCLEIIVVDDGSSDGTEELVSSYDRPEIRYIRHETNQGQNAARNTALRAARGELVAFLDSDDEWLPEFLEKCLCRFEVDPRVAHVYTRAWCEADGRRVVSKPFHLEGDIYREALAQGYVSHMITLVTRRETALAVGLFDTSFNVCDDDDFCLRLAKNGSFGLIKEPLAVIHVDGGDQTTSNPEEYAAGFHRLIAKFEQDIGTECGPGVLSLHLERCGDLFWRAGQKEMALASYRRAAGRCNRLLPVLKRCLLRLGLSYELALGLKRCASISPWGKSC